MEDSREAIKQQLDSIFKARYHGAVNIRGIRYQLLYSVLRAFDLYREENATAAIRPEGIEDVDLLGLHVGDVYVQAKTADDPWVWSQLKKPLVGFLEEYRINPHSHFVLAVNFPLLKDIARLAQVELLGSQEKRRIEKNFRSLCHQIGATSIEANGLLTKLEIVSLSEEQILSKLSLAISDSFELGSEAADIYILVLVAKFLEWAKDRKTVTRSDLDDIRDSVGENLARESIYQAYGRGLVSRIVWEPEEGRADFFEGKGGTRPSHIAANLDVKRTRWLERIDQALHASKICILRSSSGQGKSVLLYRHARDSWPSHAVFILRVAESREQVEQICNYLSFKTRLGIPLLLLIDNVGWQTPLWAAIAQECLAMGIYVLVSVRHEDWFRFPFDNWETLEPTLDLDEAQQIFAAFRTERRLHPSVDAPEWAYERIGEPHLLMEYVYFLTHGQMLEQRLRSQLQQFSLQREDRAKFEIVRRVALADALGCPVVIQKLLKDIPLGDDPQRVLLSLSEEYLKLEGAYMTGLHWVRSDHLAHLLHEGYPNPADTALALIDAVPTERTAVLVANALTREGLDQDSFLAGLVEKAKEAEISMILAFLDGIFEAGEQQFYKENQDVFREMYDHGGPLSLLLLGLDTMPVISSDLLGRMRNWPGGESEGVQRLLEIKAKVRNARRGLDLCRDFLRNVNRYIGAETLRTHPGETGILLDWCALCTCTLSAWPSARDDLLAETDWFDLPLDVFCRFTQGLYRYDEPVYQQWFSHCKKDLLSYLQLHTDCIELTLAESAVSIQFFPDPHSAANSNEQAVSRLRWLRSALPFCERYQAQGIWIMPFGLPKPSVDETHKDMPAENLPFSSDVQKNEVWRKCMEGQYLPDSYYRYEEGWYKLRQTALLFVQRFSQGVQSILTGRDFDVQVVFEHGQLFTQLENVLKFIPRRLSEGEVENMGEMFPQPLRAFVTEEVLGKWSSTFRNFFHQIFQFMADHSGNRATGELATYNFLNVFEHLPALHRTFASLFQHAPDYFSASELNLVELAAYKGLADLLEVWVLEPPAIPQRDITRYIREKEREKQQMHMQRLRDVATQLEQQGVSCLFSPRVHILYPLAHPVRYFPCAFSIRNLYHLGDDLKTAIMAMGKVVDIADIFCFIPTYEGSRFLEGGYQLHSSQIEEIRNGKPGQLESLTPVTIPDSVLDDLPPIPFQTSGELQVQAGVLALLGALQVLIEREERLKTLEVSGNRFQRELCRRYTEKLREAGNDIGNAASELRELFAIEFLMQENTSNYRLVKSFLESVVEACQQDTISGLWQSAAFNGSDIISTLESLACSHE
jgi:hypothetical protein